MLLELKYDGRYTRLSYLVLLPIFAGFASCSALVIISSIFQILLPVGDSMGNSRYYSAVAPNPARFSSVELPHITIQIPVFTESLTK